MFCTQYSVHTSSKKDRAPEALLPGLGYTLSFVACETNFVLVKHPLASCEPTNTSSVLSTNLSAQRNLRSINDGDDPMGTLYFSCK
jgi:hypothetical protein